MSAATLALTCSLLMLTVGVVLLQRGRQQTASERVMQRLADGRGEETSQRSSNDRLHKLLLRAGLTLSVRTLYIALTVTAVAMVWIGSGFGPWAVLAVGAALVVAIQLLLRWRYRRRLQRMTEQLPAFLEHAIRSLKSGRTLADAMVLAMTKCQSPLRDAFAGTRRSIELGVSLGEAMQVFADLYRSTEFRILALGVAVNQRHGGNASEVLDNLVRAIRDRESAARQLRALTGETRISALVLAALPVGLAAYILASNPEFFLGLWRDATGQMLLYTALGLQIVGCYLLWRMMRSI